MKLCMENSKHNIAIITNVIPNYRTDFYRRIINDESMNIMVYCQPSIPGMNLETVNNLFAKNIILLKSISMRKEKLAWQFLPFWQLYKNHDLFFFPATLEFYLTLFIQFYSRH